MGFASVSQADRRIARRYPVDTSVLYKLLPNIGVHFSRGRVLNLSSIGVLFQGEPGIPLGSAIELVIPWPATRGLGTGIKLSALGQTIREEGNSTVVRIDQSAFEYDF